VSKRRSKTSEALTLRSLLAAMSEDVRQLNPDLDRTSSRRRSPKASRALPESAGERAWDTYWERHAPTQPHPVKNFRFHEERNWLMDRAWVDERVCVEIDGGQFVVNGGRHNTDEDRLKCNTATSRGWLVFHFTPQALDADPLHCIALVTSALDLRR
jgi:very-short-patch-repair endonuclease